MFFLSIKKTIFDVWDNLGILIIMNLVILILGISGIWPILVLLDRQRQVAFFLLPLLILLLTVGLGCVSILTWKITGLKYFDWKEAARSMLDGFLHSVLFACFISVFIFLSFLATSYYAGIELMWSSLALGFMFWICLAVYFTANWFFAVKNQMSGGFALYIKKSFLIMLDNLGLSIFISLVIIPFNLILWPLTAFTCFGPAGIHMYINNSMRLLDHKYSWLTSHPESVKKKIPWAELLLDEKEKIGNRTLKDMIFPWKL